MLAAFGERQQKLLRLLHRCKSGLTIDELAAKLGITRTAVKQHLLTLEQACHVEKGSLRFTKGRPKRAYSLTQSGIDLFPKQYSWFSSLLLRAIKAERGSEGLNQHLRDIAGSIAHALAARVEKLDGPKRATEIVAIMNELSYEAETPKKANTGETAVIEARNCVYHHLAEEFPELCQFDIELLSKLSAAEVTHEECIVRGGECCRFILKRPR